MKYTRKNIKNSSLLTIRREFLRKSVFAFSCLHRISPELHPMIYEEKSNHCFFLRKALLHIFPSSEAVKIIFCSSPWHVPKGGRKRLFRWKIDSVLRLTCDSFMIVTSALVVTSIHVSRFLIWVEVKNVFNLEYFPFCFLFWLPETTSLKLIHFYFLFSRNQIHDRNWPASAVKFPTVKRFRLCANWSYIKGMCRRYWVGRKQRLWDKEAKNKLILTLQPIINKATLAW